MSSRFHKQARELLHPAELEILEEFAEELHGEELAVDFEVNLQRHLAKAFQRVLVNRAAQIPGSFNNVLGAANLSIRQTKAGKSKTKSRAKPSKNFSAADSKSSPSPEKSGSLSPFEREVFEELGTELEDITKKSRRLPAAPTRAEIRTILDIVKDARDNKKPKKLNDARDYIIIRLLYATGCRRSELENIRMTRLLQGSVQSGIGFYWKQGGPKTL